MSQEIDPLRELFASEFETHLAGLHGELRALESPDAEPSRLNGAASEADALRGASLVVGFGALGGAVRAAVANFHGACQRSNMSGRGRTSLGTSGRCAAARRPCSFARTAASGASAADLREPARSSAAAGARSHCRGSAEEAVEAHHARRHELARHLLFGG